MKSQVIFKECTIKIEENNSFLAKSWGDKRNPVVLVIHGLLDNAGTFDHLVPLLPTAFYYFCVDLPGHGLSSHFPPFFPVTSANFLPSIKLVIEYLKKNENDRVILMCHSLGAHIGLLISLMFPNEIEKAIYIEPFFVKTQHVSEFRETLQRYFVPMNKTDESQYQFTFDESWKLIKKFRGNSQITEAAAKSLVKRALKPIGDNKFQFTTDPRNRKMISAIQHTNNFVEYLVRYPPQYPILIIVGLDSHYSYKLYSEEIINVLKTRKNVKILSSDGNHDLHINNPVDIAGHISQFLLNIHGKL